MLPDDNVDIVVLKCMNGRLTRQRIESLMVKDRSLCPAHKWRLRALHPPYLAPDC